MHTAHEAPATEPRKGVHRYTRFRWGTGNTAPQVEEAQEHHCQGRGPKLKRRLLVPTTVAEVVTSSPAARCLSMVNHGKMSISQYQFSRLLLLLLLPPSFSLV